MKIFKIQYLFLQYLHHEKSRGRNKTDCLFNTIVGLKWRAVVITLDEKVQYLFLVEDEIEKRESVKITGNFCILHLSGFAHEEK